MAASLAADKSTAPPKRRRQIGGAALATIGENRGELKKSANPDIRSFGFPTLNQRGLTLLGPLGNLYRRIVEQIDLAQCPAANYATNLRRR
jgi:hypothetical protein